ncbi:Peptidase, U32 family, partial [Pseudomonas savastanoi pv. glycinea]
MVSRSPDARFNRCAARPVALQCALCPPQDPVAMSLPKHHLELLSPARDVTIAREAILHGADAVYIGGASFGA